MKSNSMSSSSLSHYAEVPPFVAFGYEPKTTFWGDFGVGDDFGKSAVKDTFKRAFAEYKDDKVYGTELAMVLNHKSWQWAEKDEELSQLYVKLFYELDGYIMDNWKGDKLKYYLEVTD